MTPFKIESGASRAREDHLVTRCKSTKRAAKSPREQPQARSLLHPCCKTRGPRHNSVTRPLPSPDHLKQLRWRATVDSNHRPSAPEAPDQWSDNERLEVLWDRLGTTAEKYLKALSGRSRFVHRYGRDLADEILAEVRRRRRRGGG